MSRTRPVLLLFLAPVFVAAGVAAESSRAPALPGEKPMALSGSSAESPSGAVPAPRAISSATAARLAAVMPKYQPPVVAKPAELTPALRETDKPRNTIIRLPDYVVQEKKPPVFKERELRTPLARRELAFKRHPGLRLGNFFGLNEGMAGVLLAQEERLERKREFEELVTLLQFSEPAEHETVKREVQRAFMHDPGFGR